MLNLQNHKMPIFYQKKLTFPKKKFCDLLFAAIYDLKKFSIGVIIITKKFNLKSNSMVFEYRNFKSIFASKKALKFLYNY